MFVAILGILALLGMITKNAVILIGQIESERAQGKDVRQAAIDASSSRFRPIMLTAVVDCARHDPDRANRFLGSYGLRHHGGLAGGNSADPGVPAYLVCGMGWRPRVGVERTLASLLRIAAMTARWRESGRASAARATGFIVFWFILTSFNLADLPIGALAGALATWAGLWLLPAGQGKHTLRRAGSTGAALSQAICQRRYRCGKARAGSTIAAAARLCPLPFSGFRAECSEMLSAQ